MLHGPKIHKIEAAVSCEINPDRISKDIMMAIDADFSHFLWIINGGEYAWHAADNGFEKLEGKRWQEFLATHTFPWRREVPIPDESFLRGYIKRAEGTRYSMSQYPGFLLRWKWFKNMFANGKEKTVCSEIGYDIAVDCLGMPDTAEEARDFVDPKEMTFFIDDWLKGLGVLPS